MWLYKLWTPLCILHVVRVTVYNMSSTHPTGDGTTCSVFSLPYRVVYAVASMDSVLLYDTQHSAPFAYVSNIHYAGITDLTWLEVVP